MAQVTSVRLRRDLEVHLLARDSSTAHVADVRRHAIEPESLRKRHQPLRAQPEIDQRSQGHVPGNAAERIENGYRHRRKKYPAGTIRCQAFLLRLHAFLTEVPQR